MDTGGLALGVIAGFVVAGLTTTGLGLVAGLVAFGLYFSAKRAY